MRCMGLSLRNLGKWRQTLIAHPVSILKSLWSRRSDGRWGITDIKGIDLKPERGFISDYFKVEGDLELLTSSPSKNIHEAMASFGTTSFLMKQSILPVVAWAQGDSVIRCIGTASVISCSGYVLTAAHVLADPFDAGYGAERSGNQIKFAADLIFGVSIPCNPVFGAPGFRFFPFEKLWYWGQWKQSPLFHEPDRFDYATDVAICKIPQMPDGAAHQPLSMSLNAFVAGESAYSIGYAEMEDIPIEVQNGSLRIKKYASNLYVSIGSAMQIFPENHHIKEVPTPGPCFDFDARIPGKMSGAPIFGAEGAVIRGVVSRSYSGEQHAYGAMLGPAMDLPLDEPGTSGRTLKSLMESGNEGIAQVFGVGL